MPHLFHFDVVEVVLFVLLLICHSSLFWLEVALKDDKVKFAVLSRGKFSQKLHAPNLLVLDHEHGARVGNSERLCLDARGQVVAPDVSGLSSWRAVALI